MQTKPSTIVPRHLTLPIANPCLRFLSNSSSAAVSGLLQMLVSLGWLDWTWPAAWTWIGISIKYLRYKRSQPTSANSNIGFRHLRKSHVGIVRSCQLSCQCASKCCHWLWWLEIPTSTDSGNASLWNRRRTGYWFGIRVWDMGYGCSRLWNQERINKDIRIWMNASSDSGIFLVISTNSVNGTPAHPSNQWTFGIDLVGLMLSQLETRWPRPTYSSQSAPSDRLCVLRTLHWFCLHLH